jgi:beta-phosphoglucomutase-like phosphatase (HAD superfamily)
MKRTAVIFDMDGLMFDTQCIYDRAYDEIMMERYGCKAPMEMHLAMMGSSGEDIIAAAASFMPEGADARSFIREGFDRVAELVKTELAARPGLEVILPYLEAKGYRMGLASGSERKVVDSNLETSGLRHYFDASLCGDEVTHGKPQRDPGSIQSGLHTDHDSERCTARSGNSRYLRGDLCLPHGCCDGYGARRDLTSCST